LSKVIQATSEEIPLRINGHSLTSLSQIREIGTSKNVAFAIPDFRQLPLDEFTPIEIAYDLRDDEDYAKLIVEKEMEVTKAEQLGETVTFRWTPQNYVGDYELTLMTFNRKREMIRCIPFVLRIIPWKVHENDFFQLYNDLRERHLQIYDLISPATIEEIKDRRNRSNFLEQAKFLEKKIKEIENVVFLISQNPKKKVVHALERKLLHEAYGIDYHTLLDLAEVHEKLIPAPTQGIASQLQAILTHKRTRSSYLPEKVISRKTEISYDVFENRLLKKFLKMLIELLSLYTKTVEQELQRKKLGELENKESIHTLEKILSHADQLKKRVSSMLNYAFLQEVGLTTWLTNITPTLEREANYRRFYQIYQDFLWSPYFQTSDIFKLSIKDLPTIYENWSTLFVCESILGLTEKKWTLINQSILVRHRLGYALDIKRSELILSLRKKMTSINVFFQKAFTPKSHPYWSYTHTQRPDITIEVKTKDSSRLLIFDPKYRYSLQFGEDPESAINKMHVYKDSIRDPYGKKVVSKAFVLYPGKIEEPLENGDMEFRVGVSEFIGAIALRPAPVDELISRKTKILSLILDSKG
jgi:hypothetical protein